MVIRSLLRIVWERIAASTHLHSPLADTSTFRFH